ncbi:MAG: hypothetical protein IID37_01955 [Planctomycetes bacterium]|nr:hypothetical protein [Planctomycetota bacterium]
MPQRQKMLLSVLVAMAVLLLGGRTVYPRWIKPLFDVSQEIASSEAELQTLVGQWDRYMKAQAKYKEYVLRSGGTDAKQVKNDLLAQLNRLISECDLTSKGITPQTPKVNRKTHLQEFRFDVRAEGKLESVIRFLLHCEELPQLVRLAEIRLNPASTGRRGKTEDRVALFCRLEVVVPSAVDGTMAVKVGPGDQPEKAVRHQGDAEWYASIWDGQPFTEWQEPESIVSRPPRTDETRNDPPPIEPVRRDRRENKDTLVDLVAIYGDGEHMVQEVHTRPKRGRNRGQYRSLGDDMDGGKLVMVHPLGAVVRREGEDYFYPRGLTFGDSMELAEAHEYPEVVARMRWLEESGALDGEKDQDHESDTANEESPDGEVDSAARTESGRARDGVSRSGRGKPGGKSGAAGGPTSGSGKRSSQSSQKVRKGSTSGHRPVPMSERVHGKAEGKANDDDGVDQSDDGDSKGDTGDKIESPQEKKKQTDESDADKKEAEKVDDSDEAKDDN